MTFLGNLCYLLEDSVDYDVNRANLLVYIIWLTNHFLTSTTYLSLLICLEILTLKMNCNVIYARNFNICFQIICSLEQPNTVDQKNEHNVCI